MAKLQPSAFIVGVVWCGTFFHLLTASLALQYCDEKYQSYPKHTACLPPRQGMDAPTVEGVSTADREEILRVHNMLRGEVEPPATNMQKLYWDDEVAMIAQKWASNCVYDHDKERFIPDMYDLGQNVGKNHRNWTHVITSWHSEVRDFEYGVGKINHGPKVMIGHYTQVVWAKSSRIGCGFAVCPGKKLYVCNYAPNGNLQGGLKRPYEAGPRASSCPNNEENGLCDCSAKICLNRGKLNLNSCTCDCLNKAWFNHSGSCELDCSKASDMYYCASRGGPWDTAICKQYYRVGLEYCPITCGLCPPAE